MFFTTSRKPAIFCQYQDQFCDITIDSLSEIPNFFTAIPSFLTPYLVGIQVYQTGCVRCNFSSDSKLSKADFFPGSITLHSLPDNTVSLLISTIVNTCAKK